MLLIAGIAVRPVALDFLPVLIGAVYIHSGNGWVFSNPNGGWEFPLFLIVASLVQGLLGSGSFVLSLRRPPRRQFRRVT